MDVVGAKQLNLRRCRKKKYVQAKWGGVSVGGPVHDTKEGITKLDEKSGRIGHWINTRITTITPKKPRPRTYLDFHHGRQQFPGWVRGHARGTGVDGGWGPGGPRAGGDGLQGPVSRPRVVEQPAAVRGGAGVAHINSLMANPPSNRMGGS